MLPNPFQQLHPNQSFHWTTSDIFLTITTSQVTTLCWNSPYSPPAYVSHRTRLSSLFLPALTVLSYSYGFCILHHKIWLFAKLSVNSLKLGPCLYHFWICNNAYEEWIYSTLITLITIVSIIVWNLTCIEHLNSYLTIPFQQTYG